MVVNPVSYRDITVFFIVTGQDKLQPVICDSKEMSLVLVLTVFVNLCYNSDCIPEYKFKDEEQIFFPERACK